MNERMGHRIQEVFHQHAWMTERMKKLRTRHIIKGFWGEKGLREISPAVFLRNEERMGLHWYTGLDGGDAHCHEHSRGCGLAMTGESHVFRGNLPRRAETVAHATEIPQPESEWALLWLAVWGTFQTAESPLRHRLCSLSLCVLTLCQDCKIFLMTGHVLHLDSMVVATRSFLFSLVEVIML